MTDKTTMTREQFEEQARSLRALVGDEKVKLTKHTFRSGAVGWRKQKNICVEVDGKILRANLQVNLTVIGSAPASEETA